MAVAVKLIESGVKGQLGADALLVEPAIGTQRPHPRGQGRIPGHDRAAVARATEVLRRIERESSEVSPAPDHAPVDAGAMRLRAIFHDCKPMAFGKRHEARHVHGIAMQMNREDRHGS